MSQPAPAWSDRFSPEKLQGVSVHLPSGPLTGEWAWGGSAGEGIRVGIIDSGVDNDHPAVAGTVTQWASFAYDRDSGKTEECFDEHEDSFGHGTACADVIRRLAPKAELVSIKILGKRLGCRGNEFLRALRWALDQNLDLINLSLGTRKKEFYSRFHELTEEAYFRNVGLITAANNMPIISFPSLYSSVFSVACAPKTDEYDPFFYLYNPQPPPEFGAPGIGLDLAWLKGGTLTVTGNSFAAPHITGLLARIRSKHPDLNHSLLKSVLQLTARNVT